MRLKSDLALLLAAVIWGTGFVAQRFAAASLGAFYFNAGRFLLAALFLLPLARFRIQVERRQAPLMILAGMLLFIAAGLQQWGLATTSIGNASFITGLYVVLVPVILFFLWKKEIHWLSWAAAMLAAAGVALLSLQDEFRLAPGDLLELVGAFVWALHLILVGKIAGQNNDVLGFAILQFAACGALSLAAGLALDLPGAAAFSGVWLPVLYSALLPVAFGFTLQVVGQKHAPATDAAVILSLEAVFSTLFGYLVLDELLSLRQILGCAIILAAMLLAQLKRNPALTPQPYAD